jgi:hypothetical protein
MADPSSGETIPSDEPTLAIRKIYEEYRKTLDENAINQSNLLDKAILTLSAGFLSFSLVFIEKIVPVRESIHTWLLIISWIAFGISTITTLFSLFAATACSYSYLKQFEDHYRANEEILNEIKSNWRFWTVFLTRLSALFFLLGLTALISFTIVNIDNKSDMQKIVEKKIVENKQAYQNATRTPDR